MIYTTEGLRNSTMQLAAGTGTPQEDFEYIYTQEPKIFCTLDREYTNNTDAISIAKANGIYFIAGEIAETEKGYRRNNKNLLTRSLLVLDIDDTEYSLDELKELMNEKIGRYSFMLYPTASHSPTKTKARLVVLPEKDLNQTEYTATINQLEARIGLEIDQASFTWSQLMGLPLSYVGMVEEFRPYINHGDPYPIRNTDSTKEKRKFTGRNETIIEAGGRNNSLFSRGIKYHKDGLAEHEILKLLIDMNTTMCNPPLDISEVERIYRSIVSYEKMDYNTEKEGNILVREGAYHREKYVKGGIIYEKISNFVFRPTRLIEYVDIDEDDLVEGHIVLEDGKDIFKRLKTSSFNDVKAFKDALGSLFTSFTGSKEDLQAIKVLISKICSEIARAYLCGGMHNIDCSWHFISQEGSIDSNLSLNPNILSPNSLSIQTSIEHKREILREELESIGKYLFDFNTLGNCVAIMGFTGAVFLKERLFANHGIKFPQMIISGEAGSGKSTTVKNIIMNMLSIESTEHAASGITKFISDIYISSNNTLPFIIEEFKPGCLKPQTYLDLSNIARSSYDQQTSSRGRKDLSATQYPLKAPLIIVGEASFDETAIVERSIPVSFSKKYSLMKSENFEEIEGSEVLAYLGRSILNQSLMINEMVLQGRIEKYESFIQTCNELKVDRLKNNIMVLLLGIEIIKDVFKSKGLDLEEFSGLSDEDYVSILVDLVVEESLDSRTNTKSAVDNTIELMMAAYEANTDHRISSHILTKKIDGKEYIGVKLKKMHPVMSKYVKEYNINESYLTKGDLMKQIKKMPYFTEFDGKDTYKISYDGTSGMYAMLDVELLREAGIDTSIKLQ